jgi:hypothetical protein
VVETVFPILPLFLLAAFFAFLALFTAVAQGAPTCYAVLVFAGSSTAMDAI